jgi:glyoxylase-like metal-dependent hydrolase (beta-lactamase superfamily II)
VRAVSLHPDVIVVTSAVLHVNCVVVRGAVGESGNDGSDPRRAGGSWQAGGSVPLGESFVIDSPVLPGELDALPTLIEQARFPTPSGLLATHGDWDHLLGRLAFPDLALGCAETTGERLRAAPGDAQRELRAFDEELMIERTGPLALGSVQALPVPGRCELGDRELELHPADGHTPDGMAVLIGWAGVLVVGDYLSSRELPTVNLGSSVNAYVATLERLEALVARVEHVVPGHGPVLDGDHARTLLREDARYLRAVAEQGAAAELPAGRRGGAQRRLHLENVAADSAVRGN